MKALPASFRLPALFLLLVAFAPVALAQNQRQSTIPPSDISSPSEEQHAPGSIEEEMRAKRAIKFAEAEHKETLERADELLEVSAKLLASYRSKRALDKDDNKRLDRLEKLAKQLRSRAGGSNNDAKVEKPPASLEGAVERVSDASESLSSLVKKTPRRVVNAAVIDEANVLLQLIDMVRNFSR